MTARITLDGILHNLGASAPRQTPSRNSRSAWNDEEMVTFCKSTPDCGNKSGSFLGSKFFIPIFWRPRPGYPKIPIPCPHTSTPDLRGGKHAKAHSDSRLIFVTKNVLWENPRYWPATDLQFHLHFCKRWRASQPPLWMICGVILGFRAFLTSV